MKYIPFYSNIAHEQEGRVMKTKHIWVGDMIKFMICATLIYKYFYLERYT